MLFIMRIFYLNLLLTLLSSFHLLAQNKNTDNHTTDPETIVYTNGLRYGDYEVAKNAIYALMAKHPENRSYLDSLCRIYFSMGAYAQCVLTGNEYLKDDTSNVMVMELVAISYSSLNRYKESLEMYEKLWKKTASPYY